MQNSDLTVIFDLDGTIYQNTTFHRDYIRTLVDGTERESWERALVWLTEEILSGRELIMNRFYRRGVLNVSSVQELAGTLRGRLCPEMGYEEALHTDGILYLGDAWAVLALLGESIGCLQGERSDFVYRSTRESMERKGMQGSLRLKQALTSLQQRCRVILLSNSYEATVREFLRQLGFDGVFREICSSAHKPFGMIESLRKLDPEVLRRPQTLLSIGDHAFNDLMPIAAVGGKTLWMNPYSGIHKPHYDWSLQTLDELADFLDTLAM